MALDRESTHPESLIPTDPNIPNPPPEVIYVIGVRGLNREAALTAGSSIQDDSYHLAKLLEIRRQQAEEQIPNIGKSKIYLRSKDPQRHSDELGVANGWYEVTDPGEAVPIVYREYNLSSVEVVRCYEGLPTGIVIDYFNRTKKGSRDPSQVNRLKSWIEILEEHSRPPAQVESSRAEGLAIDQSAYFLWEANNKAAGREIHDLNLQHTTDAARYRRQQLLKLPHP